MSFTLEQVEIGAEERIYVDEFAESLAERPRPSGLPVKATTNDLSTVLGVEVLSGSPAVGDGEQKEQIGRRY